MAMTFAVPLGEVAQDETERFGGKAANLGRLLRLGAQVPPGFSIAADALDFVLEANGVDRAIGDLAAKLDFEDFAAVEARTGEIRDLIQKARMPGALQAEIVDRYEQLVSGRNRFVAVRSSVAVRETPISSFPGMMDTYHYVLGSDEVLSRVSECWASLWSTRAAYIRHHKRIPHRKAVIAPIVQSMVDSDTAGVLFTANPVSKEKGEIVIEANWGLGESVVSGKSMNDYFVLGKANHEIRQKRIAMKTVMVVMDDAKGFDRCERDVPEEKSKLPTLSEQQLHELAQLGERVEADYGSCVDIEWAYQEGKLYVLQARTIRNLD